MNGRQSVEQRAIQIPDTGAKARLAIRKVCNAELLAGQVLGSSHRGVRADCQGAAEKQDVNCTFAWNAGSHFKEPDIRTAKALARVLERSAEPKQCAVKIHKTKMYFVNLSSKVHSFSV